MSFVVVFVFGLCRSRQQWCVCGRVRMCGTFLFGATQVPFLLLVLLDSAYTPAILYARWHMLVLVSLFCMVLHAYCHLRRGRSHFASIGAVQLIFAVPEPSNW